MLVPVSTYQYVSKYYEILVQYELFEKYFAERLLEGLKGWQINITSNSIIATDRSSNRCKKIWTFLKIFERNL